MTSEITDHDLLITLHEQIKQVRTDIAALKDGTADKIADHEKRIRAIETTSNVSKGQERVIQTIINAFISMGLILATKLLLK